MATARDLLDIHAFVLTGVSVVGGGHLVFGFLFLSQYICTVKLVRSATLWIQFAPHAAELFFHGGVEPVHRQGSGVLGR
jgi:hypothetical protein